MKLTDTLTLRELTELEASTPELLPHELRISGFPYLVPDWCWVVEHEGIPIALVVTSFAHGILFFWRVLATSSAKRVALNWLLAAMPKILENAKQRGCLGYGTLFKDSSPVEVRIARILQRNGAMVEPWIGGLIMAPLYRKEE